MANAETSRPPKEKPSKPSQEETSKPPQEEASNTAKAPTAAQVAKGINRKPAEILDFKDYGAYVVAVTVDGQKVRWNKDAKA